MNVNIEQWRTAVSMATEDELTRMCYMLLDEIELCYDTMEETAKSLRRRDIALVKDEEGFMQPNAKNSDMETSHIAADVAKFRCSKDRKKVLVALYEHHDLTDYELEKITGVRQNSICKRRLECERAGLVEPYWLHGEEQRRKGAGSLCTVWCLSAEGQSYVIEHALV